MALEMNALLIIDWSEMRFFYFVKKLFEFGGGKFTPCFSPFITRGG